MKLDLRTIRPDGGINLLHTIEIYRSFDERKAQIILRLENGTFICCDGHDTMLAAIYAGRPIATFEKYPVMAGWRYGASSLESASMPRQPDPVPSEKLDALRFTSPEQVPICFEVDLRTIKPTHSVNFGRAQELYRDFDRDKALTSLCWREGLRVWEGHHTMIAAIMTGCYEGKFRLATTVPTPQYRVEKFR